MVTKTKQHEARGEGWGHSAGGGANLVDTKFIDDRLKELLAS